ncbi:GDP-perosamine N-acetyltransferase [Variovorax defluvii]|uniref:GDP-perosamine N-acetyltransferase n=1 Tax=Variovorax defluvii TaxID=913761 RepID=A0ABP8IGX3_9BURK
MNGALFAVYGASGCGRSVMPLARAQLQAQGIAPARLVFVDDRPESAVVNGQRLLRYEEFLDAPATTRHAVLAIAQSGIRERLADRCRVGGVQAWTLIAANAVVMDDVTLGEGAILSPFVTLGSNVRIGRHFHANLYCYVEHDSVIGDFVTFAPGVKCNGNVVVEDHAYVGAGAVIKHGRPGQPMTIGRGAVVGMGAVVTRDVPAGVTVAGNPARPLVKGRSC